MSVCEDNRPYVEVEIGGNKIIGLLDSGAQASIAGKELCWIINRLGLTGTKSNAIVKTADGTQHVVSLVVKIPMYFDGSTKLVDTLVVPTMSIKLILGINFWNTFNIKPLLCDEVEISKTIPVSEICELDSEQAIRLQGVLLKMPFSKEGELSKTRVMTHSIDTGDAAPIKQRQYIVSPYLQKDINIEIDRLLGLGVIYSCPSSAWNNPIVAVRKSSGKVRLCLDARKINSVTVKDAYPLQQINRILGRLEGTRVLSSIDFSDAYLQVPLDESSQPKTAFSVSGRGYFAYARMPFGLCNSGATLCRLVDRVIGCDLEPRAFVYLDDIIVATKTFEEHLEVLDKIATRLSAAGLTISIDKSRFCMRSLKYLGYVVSEQGISPDVEKVASIANYPTPKNVKDVRRLLGVVGWYRRFIPQFATVTAPLTEMLKKSKTKFIWSDDSQSAFEKVKCILTSSPILANPDYARPFIIQTDASNYGVGAVLLQGEGDDERVISFMSKKLSPAEQKYQTTERECLAVLMAIDKFRPYIEGVKFTVVTDHASLLWLQNLRDPAGRLGRWALRLQAYNFDLLHRKGSLMVVADALSRAIDSVDIKIKSKDVWYETLVKKVIENPENYPQFRVENGILSKYCDRGKKANGYGLNWRVVVPKESRQEVMFKCHDDPLSAHGGYLKTLDRVNRKHYWPKMDKDVRNYVNKCDVCKASKQSSQCQKAPMGKYREVKRPWQMIYMDFVGPLPRSKGGFCYMFVVVDAFSKFVHIQPLRAATSKSIISFLRDRIFYTFGVPEIVVSDNGQQFSAKEFKRFLDSFEVKLWFTSRYHPQANAAEAANKVIGTSIRAYIKDASHHRDWDCHLAEIASAMNSATHTSTKFSPYFINFGQNIIISGKEYASQSQVDIPRLDNLSEIRLIVAENLLRAFETSKQRYDLRSRPISYKPGDIVWKRNFILSDAAKGISAKLCPKYEKCVIESKVGSNTYSIKNLNGKSLGLFSTQHLKPDLQ